LEDFTLRLEISQFKYGTPYTYNGFKRKGLIVKLFVRKNHI